VCNIQTTWPVCTTPLSDRLSLWLTGRTHSITQNHNEQSITSSEKITYKIFLLLKEQKIQSVINTHSFYIVEYLHSDMKCVCVCVYVCTHVSVHAMWYLGSCSREAVRRPSVLYMAHHHSFRSLWDFSQFPLSSSAENNILRMKSKWGPTANNNWQIVFYFCRSYEKWRSYFLCFTLACCYMVSSCSLWCCSK